MLKLYLILQALDQLGNTRFDELYNKVCNRCHILEDLKKSTFLPIVKKSKAVSCSDYRIISQPSQCFQNHRGFIHTKNKQQKKKHDPLNLLTESVTADLYKTLLHICVKSSALIC